jgi:hypothetical protein
VALLITATPAFLWMLGGRSMLELSKWHLDFIRNRTWGRWVAPLWFGGWVNALAWWAGTWTCWLLLLLPAMKGVSHMGHGGNRLWMKILRRTVNGLVWSAPAWGLVVLMGGWWLAGLQTISAVSVSLVWGVTNPKLAPTEELAVAAGKVWVVPFMVLT